MALRTIVVGLGGRGRDWVREVRAASGEFVLAATVERDSATAAAAAGALGLDATTILPSLDDALARVDCDAVIVATPPADHVASCEAALAQGRAVLVEKPFALTLADAARIVALADARGVPLLVAQNYRYMRAFRTAQRFVADGRLGRLTFLQCQYFRVDHQMPAWLRDHEDSMLWGAAVHHLDAVRWIVGEPVVGVLGDRFSAPGATLPPGGSMRALLTFAGGARASYTGSYESAGHEFFERGQEFYLRFLGQHGTLHVLHRWLFWCERGKWPRPIRRGKRVMTEERTLLVEFARAISARYTSMVSGRDNLQTMAILEAYRQSVAEGCWCDPQRLLQDVGHA